MSEQIERLAKLADDAGARAPKYVVPLIRFNGNNGDFKIVDLEFKEEKDIETPVDVIILKKRKVLASFSPTVSYFTNEYNRPTQTINLYKNVSGTVTFEKAGTPEQLRNEFQALRTKEVLYVLYSGAVHKLEVKGGSLSDYFDYLNNLGEADLHTFQIVTTIGSVKTQNESKFTYYKMTFAKSDAAVDLDEVTTHMEKVVAEIGKVDAYFAGKNVEAFKNKVGDEGMNTIAVARQREVGKDDANLEDIPF